MNSETREAALVVMRKAYSVAARLERDPLTCMASAFTALEQFLSEQGLVIVPNKTTKRMNADFCDVLGKALDKAERRGREAENEEITRWHDDTVTGLDEVIPSMLEEDARDAIITSDFHRACAIAIRARLEDE